MAFTLRIIKLHKYLIGEKKEYVMSKQVYKSGTSIGANITEALYGESKKDFIHKMSIALKEANETEYWLVSLHQSNYLTEKQFESIKSDCLELIKLLTSIIFTSKKNM